MNSLERRMVDTLKALKGDYGVFEIKCEFEAEGTRMEELMRLKDVCSAAGLPIILKIGGVEAVTDIYNALAVGVKAIIAPMAETPFALSKFLGIIENLVPKDNATDLEFAFNMETITCFQNLDAMLALPKLKLLQGMTVGRVDFTGSLGLDRDAVESEQVFALTAEALRKGRRAGLRNGLGGAISARSLPFIARLNAEGLLDKYETRKVVFAADSVRHGEKAVLLEWMKDVVATTGEKKEH